MPATRRHRADQPAPPVDQPPVTTQTTPSPRRTNPTKRSPYIVIYNDAIICIFSDGQHSPSAPGSSPAAPGSTPPGEAPPPAGTAVRSPLAEAITHTLDRVTAAVATEPRPHDPAEHAATRAAAEDTARKVAAAAARRVFTPTGRRTGRTCIAGTRPPTPAEHGAARALARALDTAATRDRTPVKTTSTLPPGRLRMRGALAADAQ